MFGKRIGFLKFKADIVDKETGQKVSYHLLVPVSISMFRYGTLIC